jgi:hypothetical protein
MAIILFSEHYLVEPLTDLTSSSILSLALLPLPLLLLQHLPSPLINLPKLLLPPKPLFRRPFQRSQLLITRFKPLPFIYPRAIHPSKLYPSAIINTWKLLPPFLDLRWGERSRIVDASVTAERV